MPSSGSGCGAGGGDELSTCVMLSVVWGDDGGISTEGSVNMTPSFGTKLSPFVVSSSSPALTEFRSSRERPMRRRILSVSNFPMTAEK